jgi:hypothetical protein
MSNFALLTTSIFPAAPTLIVSAMACAVVGGGVYGGYQAYKGLDPDANIIGKTVAIATGCGLGAAEGVGFSIFGAVTAFCMIIAAEAVGMGAYVAGGGLALGNASINAAEVIGMGAVAGGGLAMLGTASGIAIPMIGTYVAEKLTPFKSLSRFISGLFGLNKSETQAVTTAVLPDTLYNDLQPGMPLPSAPPLDLLAAASINPASLYPVVSPSPTPGRGEGVPFQDGLHRF